jgi:hypothetical protein
MADKTINLNDFITTPLKKVKKIKKNEKKKLLLLLILWPPFLGMNFRFSPLLQ